MTDRHPVEILIDHESPDESPVVVSPDIDERVRAPSFISTRGGIGGSTSERSPPRVVNAGSTGYHRGRQNHGESMKKFLQCLLAANMTLALIACAAKSTPPPEAPPEKNDPPAAVEPAEPEPTPPAEPAAPPPPTRDIVDTAEGSDNFKTIVKLIEDAGLTNALREDGPLTVLVPSDEAFAKLADGELERLKKDKKSLAALLNYHVLTGRAIKSVELATMPTATTAAGPDITIESADGTITINGTVKVVQADIMTTNGVIHVIDAVLTPVAKKKAKKAK